MISIDLSDDDVATPATLAPVVATSAADELIGSVAPPSPEPVVGEAPKSPGLSPGVGLIETTDREAASGDQAELQGAEEAACDSAEIGSEADFEDAASEAEELAD